MRIIANLAACTLTLASAYFLYSGSNATRRLEAQLQAAERQKERLENDISVLKAERAYLSRAERIERAAHALGFRPPEAGDYADVQVLTNARQASTPPASR